MNLFVIILSFCGIFAIVQTTIPEYTSPCKGALDKYKWEINSSTKTAKFKDTSIGCRIQYNKKLNKYEVYDNTQIVRSYNSTYFMMFAFIVCVFLFSAS